MPDYYTATPEEKPPEYVVLRTVLPSEQVGENVSKTAKEQATMTKEYFKAWAQATAIRALKTAAETAVVLIGGDYINVIALDWPQILGVSVTAAVVTVLTCIAGLPEVPKSKEE